jgi:hypothetical protein
MQGQGHTGWLLQHDPDRRMSRAGYFPVIVPERDRNRYYAKPLAVQ